MAVSRIYHLLSVENAVSCNIMMRSFGAGAAAVILSLQAASVVRARFVGERYFCWSPHGMQVRFQLDVDLASRRLTPREAQNRHHLTDDAWEAHSAQNLIDTITMYESTLGRGDHAQVNLTYRVNEGQEKKWFWTGQ